MNDAHAFLRRPKSGNPNVLPPNCQNTAQCVVTVSLGRSRQTQGLGDLARGGRRRTKQQTPWERAATPAEVSDEIA
ncbi:MAG TPA: hypothetical protein VGJ46_03145 [Candidatus Limnocylindrales bacterium]